MISLRVIAWSLFIITILAQCPNSNSHDHGHSHDHGSDHYHDHDHDHHGHDHDDHDHDHHGHDHDDHDHDHHGHDHGSHDHSHDHGHGQEAPSFKYSQQANMPPVNAHVQTKPVATTTGTGSTERTQSSIWFKAIVSVFAISCGPLMILFFIRVDNTDRHKTALEYLLSFASGGLLGDAFLHLIPHAVMDIDVPPSAGHDYTHGGNSHDPHGHSHDDSVHAAHVGVGAYVLSGILAFLLVEVLMRAIRRRAGLSHGHSHEEASEEQHSSEAAALSDSSKPVNDSPLAAPPQKKSKNETADDSDSGTTHRRRTSSRNRSQPSGSDDAKSAGGHLSKKHKAEDNSSGDDKDKGDRSPSPSGEPRTVVQTQGMKVSAFLNLAADFAHNFTDGLAIGAGFLVGDGIGILTAVTVILHEIPHEIGDYAILVKSGCSAWKAIWLQLVTAVGALLGAILSLGLGATSGAVAWILPFTAGGFIYIATVSVLPELLESGATLCQAICQLLSLIVGVGLMALVCLFE